MWILLSIILQFNTSSLGLSDQYQSNFTLQPAIEALVPSSLTNPTSITQYIGIKDWYSLHYLSTCSGSFQLSTTNPNVLTSNKINITCVRRNAGYVFTISNILREELHPSVVGIADEVTQASYYTMSWIALWLMGIIAAFVEMFVFLPLTWYGTRRLNGYSTVVSFVCFCSSFSLPNHLLTFSDFIHLISSRVFSCSWKFPESISQQDSSLYVLRRRVLCHVIYNNGFDVCCLFPDTNWMEVRVVDIERRTYNHLSEARVQELEHIERVLG